VLNTAFVDHKAGRHKLASKHLISCYTAIELSLSRRFWYL